MFNIGSYPARTCAGVSRRSLLRVAASAPLAMGLSRARLLAEPKKARAKSVIFVFLWGAPSHLDTCDPKPDAPAEYRGPFGVIATGRGVTSRSGPERDCRRDACSVSVIGWARIP